MDEMEFTEAESNINDIIAEYQQYEMMSSQPTEPEVRGDDITPTFPSESDTSTEDFGF
jgi:tubulin beta